jgi:hypothetical protein
MYPQYTRLNVPTWIIGPALGAGPLIERPADVLKVWPAREPIERLRPAQLNARVDRLATGHCGYPGSVAGPHHPPSESQASNVDNALSPPARAEAEAAEKGTDRRPRGGSMQ